MKRNVSGGLGAGILFKRCFHVSASAAGEMAWLKSWNGVSDGGTPLVQDCGFLLSLMEMKGGCDGHFDLFMLCKCGSVAYSYYPR